MLDKAANMLDFNLLELCLKGPESELEWLDSIWGLWPGLLTKNPFCDDQVVIKDLSMNLYLLGVSCSLALSSPCLSVSFSATVASVDPCRSNNGND